MRPSLHRCCRQSRCASIKLRPARHAGASSGFSLVELLLTLLLGTLLGGLILQCVLSESQSGQKLARLLRERQARERLLELMRSEVQQASRVSVGPENPEGLVPACNLGGRELVVQLQTEQGVISYTQGAAPDGIWRGMVVMRCGPAYGLEGQLTGGIAQNRVVLDALALGSAIGIDRGSKRPIG